MNKMGEEDVKVGGQGEESGVAGGEGRGVGGGESGSRRLELAVQRGPCWLPTPSSLAKVFEEFGEIEGEVEYNQVPGRALLFTVVIRVVQGCQQRIWILPLTPDP